MIDKMDDKHVLHCGGIRAESIGCIRHLSAAALGRDKYFAPAGLQDMSRHADDPGKNQGS